MRLKDKVAIITGATNGIGLEAARLFMQEGAKVVIGSIEDDKTGNNIVDNIKKETGGEAIYVQTDVSLAAANNNLVEKTIQSFGQLDILVCNAAVHWAGTALTAAPEDYDLQFAVNVKGCGLAARAAIPYLRKSNDGNIVNIASVNGMVGMQGQSIYNASKAAVIELSYSMAIDFPEIRVNALLPGFTNTASLNDAVVGTGFELEEGQRLLAEGTLRKRLAEPIEIAKAILFLASEDASYVTASSLLVDGGMGNISRSSSGIVNDKRWDAIMGRS